MARYNALRTDGDSFPTYAASSAVQEATGWHSASTDAAAPLR